jgi:preprotein translocase subunit SecG
MIATVIAIVMILMLVASLSIDFIYASKQTKSSDKNTLISAGAMTAIAAGVLLITVIVLDHRSSTNNSAMAQQGMNVIAKHPNVVEAFI